LHIEDLREFFLKIQKEEIVPDGIIQEIELKQKHSLAEPAKEEVPQGLFDRFVATARNITGGISLFGNRDAFLHSYAKCCNPIPGDEIVGFVTKGEGIKVHLKSCKNFLRLSQSDPMRVVEVAWPSMNGGEYAAAIRISGEDRTGLLNDITHSISTYQNTNIRGLRIDTNNSMFDGTILIGVKNKEHLERIIEKLRKIKGVSRTERMVE
jgi:(p)ppGpp synthase/HD superfamily hydrolase